VREYSLERTQVVPVPIEQAFEFFGEPRNLERITPPWLRFRVVTPDPVQMGRGTLIRYRLRLHGVPVDWLTEIAEWEPGVRFRDRQVTGPYTLWDHTHTFEPDGEGGTNMGDRVVYEIPYGPLGEAAKAIFVRRDVERIFDFRAREIARLMD
jgi:ligand-binding SRPBCC domain-containing protein